MRTIWKQTLQIVDTQVFAMPAGARILCVQVQDGKPQVWLCVTPEDPTYASWRFDIVGTGNPMGEEVFLSAGEYVGTFQLPDRKFVGHVFARKQY